MSESKQCRNLIADEKLRILGEALQPGVPIAELVATIQQKDADFSAVNGSLLQREIQTHALELQLRRMEQSFTF